MRALLAGAAAAALALTVATGCDAPSTSPAPVITETTAAPAVSRPARIKIPSLQVDSAIIDLGLQPDGKMEVPPDAKDAGWYTSSPIPGKPGPSVLAAHVNFKGVDGPFAHIDQLKAGDEVVIEDDNGASATFTVTKVERFAKDAFPTDEVYGDVSDPELRMITCGGDLDRAAHSYKDNIIVSAVLAA